jgi:hypothetical protein
LHYPAAAEVSCDTCQRFMFDPQEGSFHRLQDGFARERPKGSPTPCGVCPKVAGRPADKQNSQEGSKSDLSEKNRRTIELYYENEAIPLAGNSGGEVIIDGITRRNFGIIRRAIDEFDRWQQRQVASMLRAVTVIGKIR